MTAAPETSPTDAALRPGLDVAIRVLENRLLHFYRVRIRTEKPMGVIETELRDIAETLQKRRRAG